MKKLLILIPVVAALAQTPFDTTIHPSTFPQELPVDRGSSALWQSLKKLHTRASLVMVTAHPDDEDGGMMTMESRGRGARVALLTLNRGEGGANVMSNDYFDALGLVRTEELLDAGRYYGVDQYWTRVVDYGFSKTMAESTEHWTRDRVLYDVVRIVRMVRPLVITSVFTGTPSDGHGNHQVAGAMAQAVFEAAGDPNVFPDQIRAGLRPWSPLKDYARGRGGRGGAPVAANVQVPSGDYDPVLGVSYSQIAREGLGYQKSQNDGGGIPLPGQTNTTSYRRIVAKREGLPDQEKDFFEGIDVSLAGIATLAKGADTSSLVASLGKINAAVEDATAKFSATAPERCAPALATGMKETIALIDAVEKSGFTADSKYDLLHELNIKRVQFNSALAESLGLTLAANVGAGGGRGGGGGGEDSFRVAIPGQTFPVRVYAVNQGPVPATLEHLTLEASNGPAWTATPAAPVATGEISGNKPVDVQFRVTVPDNAPFTKPYFSRPDIEQSYYDISDDKFLNLPNSPYPLVAWADFRFQDAPIRIGQYVQTSKRLNGQGTVQEPLVVGPPIGVSITPRFGVVPLGQKAFDVVAEIHSNVKGPANGELKLDLPAGWKSDPAVAPFSTTQDGEDRSVSFSVTPASLSEKPYDLTAVAEFGGTQYKEGYQVTGYAGLRPDYLYTPSTYKVTGVNVETAPNLNIGYIMGTGDDVPASLENLGVKVHFLTAADVAGADLSKYDEIILGVRTYAARPELVTNKNRLLEYVKNGGVMIVEYNTPEIDHNFGPYPYVMGGNPQEVTDEASKVEILAPQNPLLNWPNKITTKDFEGWVEERGSKWMTTWDPNYEALLETHDAGQAPQKGGLLYAKYGKGVYVYNAYAFYRELPAGVPGAFRIFANVISLPRNPGR